MSFPGDLHTSTVGGEGGGVEAGSAAKRDVGGVPEWKKPILRAGSSPGGIIFTPPDNNNEKAQ